MNQSLKLKYKKLKEIISGFKTVVVAYSGGLDSAFLLYAAVKTLGAENVTAVTADSASYPRSEFEKAVQFAKSLGLLDGHKIINTDELNNPEYSSNPPERCFFCKQELYTRLTELAVFDNIDAVLDGFNADDQGDYRPGRKAADKFSIRSPLFEAELHKDEIRNLAKEFGLEIWDKPQSACLASRIPYGSHITIEKLSQVEKAEEYLRALGFAQLRVRHHDELARIELPHEDIEKIFSAGLYERICKNFRELGFIWVTVDLEGFHSGSMNKALNGRDKDV